ncbi:hypothetical protein M9Y10_033062 [Tritrichomonas musculus]|uniref:Leucine-rich repeat domain-containing protein n=1 Tax=Tritrichomonas musculus TaxID=1915356 RepID=A0ABR2GX35_9EUKA
MLKVIQNKLWYSLNEEEKTAKLIDSARSNGDIFIPRSIIYNSQEYIITTITGNSFGNSEIKTIQFPTDSGLKRIEKGAFKYQELESIILPSSLCELEDGWCVYTRKLTKIKLMPNNQHFMYLDDKILLGKTDQKSDIFDDLLFVRRDIEEVTIPSFIKRIAPHAFSHSNIQSISIPPHITQICEEAFYYCEGLQEVEFQANSELQIIGKESFSYSIIESIFIPPSVIQICEGAFSNCDNIQKVEFSKDSKIQIIENEVFAGSSIESITIPSSVVELKDGWCIGTYKLTDVTIIPSNEQNFCYYDDKLILGKSDINSDNYDVLIFARRDIIDVEIPTNIKRIAPFAFHESTVRNVFIPLHVTYIGDNAFSCCIQLDRFEVSNDSELQTIGEYAFSYSLVRYLSIPSCLLEFKKGIFAGTVGLNEINVIPTDKQNTCCYNKLILGKTDAENDEYDVIFFANRDIKKAEIPLNIKRIGSHCFSESLIERIDIPSAVTRIDDNAFTDCFLLRKVDISPDSQLQSIGKYAFSHTKIGSIFLPQHVKSIRLAFYASFNLQIVEIDDKYVFQLIDYNDFKNSNANIIIMIPHEGKTLLA